MTVASRAPGPPDAPDLPDVPQVFAVLGHPIRHSLSPALHSAAFRATGRNAVYLAFDVPPEACATALHGLAALGAGGVNLTAPLKRVAWENCDTRTAEANEAGAVNTVRIADGQLEGHNTDGAGFVRFLERAGIDPRGRRIVLLGAGGAAAGLVPALARAGGGAGGFSLALVARDPQAAARHPAFAAAGVHALSWGSAAAREAVGQADLVVQCTPLGSRAGDPLPCPADWLGREAAAVDLLYHPATSPWVAALRERGRRVANGLGLLIEQAMFAQAFWFGEEPPRRALEEAVPWAGPFATGVTDLSV